MLVERLVDQGARLAEPGEFTRRAFVSGRLDLAQAEAVALLIEARTERAVSLAARGIRGDLSRRLGALRDGLLGVIASLEVALDFPDDISGWDTGLISGEIKQLREASTWLLAACRRGLVTHAGLTIAIVGAPNAGKSSLFNALLGRERAIVTPEAGTTRDVLEGTIVIDGVPIRLLDTAGLGTPRDVIDAEGMRRARLAIDDCDLLIVVLDGSASRTEQSADGAVEWVSELKPYVLALSKSDRGRHQGVACPPGAIFTSVVTSDGLDALTCRLRAEVAKRAGSDLDDEGITASLRQVQLLEELAGGLDRAGEALATKPAEIVLVELKAALDSASSLLGVEVGDAVLDAIFSRFCVGK